MHRPHAPPVLPSSKSTTRAAALSASSGAGVFRRAGGAGAAPGRSAPGVFPAPGIRSPRARTAFRRRSEECPVEGRGGGRARAAAIPVPLASPSKSDAPNRDDAPPPKSEDVEENADAEETETDSDDGIPYPLATRERRESPPDGVVGGAARTEPSKSAPRGASSFAVARGASSFAVARASAFVTSRGVPALRSNSAATAACASPPHSSTARSTSSRASPREYSSRSAASVSEASTGAPSRGIPAATRGSSRSAEPSASHPAAAEIVFPERHHRGATLPFRKSHAGEELERGFGARARSIAATQRRRASVTGPSPTIAATSSTRSAAAEKRCGTRVGGGGVGTGHPDAAPSSITGEDGPGVGGGGGRVGGATSAVESACRRVAASFVADNVGNEDGARKFFDSRGPPSLRDPPRSPTRPWSPPTAGNAKSAKLIPPPGRAAILVPVATIHRTTRRTSARRWSDRRGGSAAAAAAAAAAASAARAASSHASVSARAA